MGRGSCGGGVPTTPGGGPGNSTKRTTAGSTRGGKTGVKAALKLEAVAVDPSSPLIAAKKPTNGETNAGGNNGAQSDQTVSAYSNQDGPAGKTD